MLITDAQFDQVVELRDRLRAKGYQASIANITCFDINQQGFIHYLSLNEATALDESPIAHPVNLHGYVTLRTAMNSWYEFPTLKY